MIFDGFRSFSDHPGVTLPFTFTFTFTLTLNTKFGVPKKMLRRFLASNAKATHGTSTYPPYVGATLPIGGRFSGFALLL